MENKKKENKKAPGNDGIKKELFETFRLEIKSPFLLY